MWSIKRTSWVLAAVIGIVACERDAGTGSQSAAPPAQPAARITPQMDTAAQTITGEKLRRVIAELSDDRYGGRLPGTEGDTLTRQYLAAELARIGFAPGTPEGGYEQPIELVGVTAEMPAVWRFERGGETVELARSTDFIAASGVQEATAEIKDAEVVFAGYAIQAPEYQWDDFKDVDVRGKVIVVLNNDPDWDPALFEGNTRLYYGRWDYKYEEAARQGATAAIIIHTQPSAGYPWQVVQTSWGGEQFELPAEADEPRLQARGWVTEEAAQRLMALAGHDLAALVEQARSPDFRPVALGLNTSIELPVVMEATETANIIGVLPGSDAALREQAVIL